MRLFRLLSRLTRRNTVWYWTNIYPSADIGRGNTIGSYTEIGPEVKIGDNNKIGAHCFIPQMVEIGSNCFIGPCVTFTNDKFPPSGEESWGKTVVKDFASIGARCVILPGVTIGEDAMIGAGSVVTKNIPAGEVWAGNPAMFLRTLRKC